MVWFRLEAEFARHPKVIGLSDGAFRLLVDCMCSVAGAGTDGLIPAGVIGNRTRSANALIKAGLLDQRADGIAVHDWEIWNAPTVGLVSQRVAAAERQRRHRAKQRLQLVETQQRGST